VAHNAMEIRISTTIVPIEEYRKRFMSTAIDTYLIVHIKIWSFFAKEEKDILLN
jgi:hypothetical protein